MSVVNQMLRDLEQRQATAEESQPVYLPMEPQRKAMPYIIIGCCFSIIAIVSFFAPALNDVLLQLPATTPASVPQNPSASDDGFVLHEKVATAPYLANSKIINSHQIPEIESVETHVVEIDAPVKTLDSVGTITMGLAKNQVLENKSQTESAATDRTKISGSPSVIQQATGMMVVQSAQNSDTRVSLLQDKARLALDMNQYSAATEHLENLLKLAPEKNAMRLLLGRIYFQQNRIEQALSTLQNTATEAAIGMEYIAFRAQLLTQTGEHRAAIADYNRLSESQPNNVKWLLGSAVAYDQLQSYNEAIIAYENIALNPNLPDNISTFVAQRIDALRTLI